MAAANGRTKMRVVGEILECAHTEGDSGIRQNVILDKTRISGSKLKTILHDLTGAGLINTIAIKGGKTYVITPKGEVYLEQYRQFADMVAAFGLDP